MRTFDLIALKPVEPGTIGMCEAWCGATREIAGLFKNDDSPLCVECHAESATRTFSTWLNGGEDILCPDLPSIEAAMLNVANYLDDPAEYACYFPILILAENRTFGLEEVIATVRLPQPRPPV